MPVGPAYLFLPERLKEFPLIQSFFRPNANCQLAFALEIFLRRRSASTNDTAIVLALGRRDIGG
jgi:hypothetical protein